MSDFVAHAAPYLGISLLLLLTGLGLPIPEELIVISTGAASSLGKLDPWLGLTSCLLGALLGDCVTYAIGLHFGRRLLKEHPWWARFLHPEREAQIEDMIRRHGLKVFFLARFLVGLRAPVYLTAGILKVPFRRFLVVDLFSAMVVIGLFYGLAYAYGEHVGKWIREGQYALTAVVVVSVLAAGGYLYLRHRQKKRAAAEDAAMALAAEAAATHPAGETKQTAL
jgi:membrane protein DedA with SNARE-associated domain